MTFCAFISRSKKYELREKQVPAGTMMRPDRRLMVGEEKEEVVVVVVCCSGGQY